MKSKFVRLIIALGVLCGAAHAQTGQSVTHGAGDPRATNPVPNCNFTKMYVDDTTGAIYSASGYPCVWIPSSGLPAGVTGNGANGLNVAGLVTATQVRSNAPIVPGLVTFGDSICQYQGATSTATGFVSLLLAQLGGALTNRCISGQTIQDEPIQLMVGGPANPTFALNPTNLEEGGMNDVRNCSTANCYANSQMALQTILSWRSTTNIVPASAASESGSWGADSIISSCRTTTTNASSAQYSITTYGSSAIGISARAMTGNGGTASVTIDGVAQAGFNAFGVGGASLITVARGSVFTFFYPVSAGAHTVVVTDTAATGAGNVLTLCGVVSGNDPSKMNYNSGPRIWSTETTPQQGTPNPTAASYAAIVAMKQATVTQLAGWGFNVLWAPVVNTPFTGAFSAANYISNQPGVFDPDGLSCAGGLTDITHPNDCGHKEIFSALMADMLPLTGGGAASASIAPTPQSLALKQNVQTTDYTLTINDGIVMMNCASPCTLTIPSLGTSAGPYFAENIGASDVTIATSGGAALHNYPSVLRTNYYLTMWNVTGNWFGFSTPLPPATMALVQTTYTTDHTVATTDGIIFMNCAAPCTLTMPNIATGGPYFVLNDGASAVTLTAGAGAGLHNYPLTIGSYQWIIIWNSATNWFGVWSQQSFANGTFYDTPDAVHRFVFTASAATNIYGAGNPIVAIWDQTPTRQSYLDSTGNWNAKSFLPTGYGTATATPGTNVTSVTCTGPGTSCTSTRGQWTIVGGTATTGTIASIAWSATPAAWSCRVDQNGGTTWLGIGHSNATTLGFNITSAVSVTGVTVIVDYTCGP